MAAGAPPKLYPYSAARLRELLIAGSISRHRDVHDKIQIEYLATYLAKLGAKTIVVESAYVDHDFLEDYSAYYVRCFKIYERTCHRLHFFSESFTLADWEQLLEGGTSEFTGLRLAKAYLGFVVARPLPLAVIGRTCVKPNHAEDGCSYPTARNYDVSLCGIPLHVETLAFQEQDEVAAKCATAALWSVFQGTGKLFQHAIPSPIEITKQATAIAPFAGRAIPSLGLTDEQVGHAIRQVGLEPIVVAAVAPDILQATAYAYLRGRIPVLINMSLSDPISHGFEDQTHAVAVTGYRLGQSRTGSALTNVTPLVAHRIASLIVHDDGIGPFVQMSFVKDKSTLTTEWPSERDKNARLTAHPTNLIIPVYHKIRIPFQAIFKAVSHLHGLLTDDLLPQFREHEAANIPKSLEWDIHLTTVNPFKEAFHRSATVGRRGKRQVLEMNLPKFLWRATATDEKGNTILDLLFDATDIETGSFFLYPVQVDPALIPLLRQVAQNNAVPSDYQKTSALEIMNWFKDNEFPTD
jgi:hypothetical protein